MHMIKKTSHSILLYLFWAKLLLENQHLLTTGLRSTSPQTEVNDHPATLQMTCGQSAKSACCC